MTTLTQLIEQYCPDGVEYVKLGDVAEVGTGKCDRKNATDDGEYPFFVRSEQVLRYPTYQFDEEAIIVPGEGGIGEIFHYINGKYALHQRAYRVHFIDEGVSARYALYAFKTFFKNYVMGRAVTATVTSLRKPMFTEFQFPFPPREVQDAIVERLDAFAALIESLDSEIALREKRFEYFREQLLNLDESEGVDFVLVCDAFRAVKTPKGIKRSNYSSLGKYPVVDQGAELIAGYTDQELSIHGDYVVFGDHTRAVKWVDFPFVVGADGTKVLRAVDGILPKFSYHCMSNLQIENLGYSRHWKIVNSMQIPLPSLEVQQDIVDKLDTMQALIDNLKQERELRKAQFEYYREKLLTFNS